MRVACFTMQKNERQLLEPWIAYHAWLFGIENLFIFDNGSTDDKVLEALQRYGKRGLRVDYARTSNEDFELKGEIIASTIRRLDAEDPYDFYFPLDCDEFVAIRDGDRPAIGRDAVAEVLAPIEGDPRPLMAVHSFMSNPLHRDRYTPSTAVEKTFFARGSCLSLGTGFHAGRTIHTDERFVTSIAYLHFHYRSYRAHQFYSRQKLTGRVREMTRAELRRLVRLNLRGRHLVEKLLMSEAEYNQFLLAEPPIDFPEFRSRLEELGAPLLDDSELFGDLPDIPEGADLPEPADLRAYLRIPAALQRWLDSFRGKRRRP